MEARIQISRKAGLAENTAVQGRMLLQKWDLGLAEWSAALASAYGLAFLSGYWVHIRLPFHDLILAQ